MLSIIVILKGEDCVCVGGGGGGGGGEWEERRSDKILLNKEKI